MPAEFYQNAPRYPRDAPRPLWVIRYGSARSAATSAFSSTGNALKDENDVTRHGQNSNGDRTERQDTPDIPADFRDAAVEEERGHG
jgi:hypothetical protein